MPEQQTNVILKVDGRLYSGWTRIEIRRGIEQIAGSFSLSIVDQWDGSEMWPISHGAECTVLVGSEAVITGYVDEVLPFFDKANHGVTVVGRDKTGDLVDCSAISASGQWAGRTLLQVATDLADPFGVKVVAATDVGKPFERAALQEGETVFEALERAARMRGVLLVADAAGNLVITRAGEKKIQTALVQGENILSARATFSMRERYRDITVKGQNFGVDTGSAAASAGPHGKAEDKNVKRYRPLIVIAEDIADNKGLSARAVWEAAVRMGRSARPEITVQGFRHASGLWQPNHLVMVRCPYLRLNREMLIVSVAWTVDEDGSRTVLELCRPEGFELLPIPETDPKGGLS